MDLMPFKDGCTIMFIGMGAVFIFLIITIAAMNLTAYVLKYVNKYFPEEVPVEKKPVKKQVSDDEEVALAIACAIHRAQQA